MFLREIDRISVTESQCRSTNEFRELEKGVVFIDNNVRIVLLVLMLRIPNMRMLLNFNLCAHPTAPIARHRHDGRTLEQADWNTPSPHLAPRGRKELLVGYDKESPLLAIIAYFQTVTHMFAAKNQFLKRSMHFHPETITNICQMYQRCILF